MIEIREATRLARFLMPCPVRVFAERDRAEAAAWLAALPETPSISVRLDEQTGIVVVEAAAPLRGVDFDALAATVDPWLSTHETVAGVFHARTVPGWENVTGLRRHLQFVREHHRRVRRVALAVDGVLPSLALAVAGHLVAPEVRTSPTTRSTTRSRGPGRRRRTVTVVHDERERTWR